MRKVFSSSSNLLSVMACRALSIKFTKARLIWSRSTNTGGKSSASLLSSLMPSSLSSYSFKVAAIISFRSCNANLAAGRRAKLENSSTILCNVATSAPISEVHSRTSFAPFSSRPEADGNTVSVPLPLLATPNKFFAMRSADKRIGVSGFLISCAIRRATSLHAVRRCASISSDKSSMTMTVPCKCACAAGKAVTVTAASRLTLLASLK